ncbi:MAG: 50S ribosomal protein L11 methyltransferase [Ginsengibacter sp.]
MEKFLQIEIKTLSQERLEVLIAELSDINFYAFEQNKNVLVAYISEERFDEAKFKGILQSDEEYELRLIENKNWNEEWEVGFKPVCVREFVGIRASFHEHLQNVKHEIIITPKMSFGTGHHATTYLMIEQMEGINFREKTVIDFGTGTGVLAILAEKLGAKEVIAIDNDEWSINNALENIRENNCKKIRVEKKDDFFTIGRPDVILANINLNVLTQNANKISSLSRSGSLLLISGFLVSDEKEILSLFNNAGFLKKKIIARDTWMSLLMERE